LTETILLDEKEALNSCSTICQLPNDPYLEPDSLTETILLDEKEALEQLLHNLPAAR
jgi:hypothetical protein